MVTDPLSANLWLLNSCTVKGPSEDTFINSVKKGIELDKHVVVAGCVPQGHRSHPWLEGLSVVGVQQIDRIIEVVEETLKGCNSCISACVHHHVMCMWSCTVHVSCVWSSTIHYKSIYRIIC